jgi:hypothetical protein
MQKQKLSFVYAFSMDKKNSLGKDPLSFVARNHDFTLLYKDLPRTRNSILYIS